jgi:hypothetical protein
MEKHALGYVEAETATTEHIPVSLANAQSYKRRKMGLKGDSFNLMTISRNEEIAAVWACTWDETTVKGAIRGQIIQHQYILSSG